MSVGAPDPTILTGPHQTKSCARRSVELVVSKTPEVAYDRGEDSIAISASDADAIHFDHDRAACDARHPIKLPAFTHERQARLGCQAASP